MTHSEYIVLVPVFGDAAYRTTKEQVQQVTDKYCERTKSLVLRARNALMSWIKNTDIVKYNVPVKLYIEEHFTTLYPEIIENLPANAIEIAEYEPLPPRKKNPHGHWGRLAKCSRAWWDTRFQERFIISPDADLFPQRGCNIIETLNTIATDKAVGIRTNGRKGLFNHSRNKEQLKGCLAKGWTLDDIDLTEKEVLDRLAAGGRPSTAIVVMPTAFRDTDFMREMIEIQPILGTEEIRLGYLFDKYNINTYNVNDSLRISRDKEMQGIKFYHGKH